MICRLLGMILLIYACLMFLPIVAGLCFRESPLPFVKSMACALLPGMLLYLQKPDNNNLVARDGFVIVGLGWILISLIGSLPFIFSCSITSYTDALFETVSGLTTTGATILSDFDAMPRCVMFWRIFNHWIGGMGVLVFIMAVLPMSGEHSMHIMRAEVPGPTVGKLVPRLKRTARILYIIYMLLTLIEMILLLCCGMSFYDALLHAFSTAGTGGFSTLSDSIAGFHNSAIEIVIEIFMILFAINFNVYYLILIGSFKKAIKNEELRDFLFLILGSVIVIAFALWKSGVYGHVSAVHEALFNVATVISTTGFGTQDFTQWPEICKWVLILLMFCGGCAGGTGGGIKLSRLLILFKSGLAELKKISRPRNIVRVQMDGRRIEDETIRATYTFVFLYSVLLLLFSFLLSLEGTDIATCFTASLSCLSNVGPGMTKIIGPSGTYAFFSIRSKLLLIVAMLLGRLEIYPILVLFSPRTWRR